MTSLLIAFTIQLRPVEASRVTDCARSLVARATSAWETKRYFAHAMTRLRQSRRRYGIQTLRRIEKAKPGQIILLNAIKCGPCINWSLRFNVRARRYPEWSFLAHDYTQDWMSDDGQISSFLVVGSARRVQLSFPCYGETRAFTEARLTEALALSSQPGPDLIWEIHRPLSGQWTEARTTPARDAFSEFEVD